MDQAEKNIAAIEEHSALNHERSAASVNGMAVALSVVIAMTGVAALQYLAHINGHHGTRADTMSIVWCVFVAAMLLNTLVKKS